MQDYLLGGKDHFAADREVAQEILHLVPDMLVAAQHGRELLARMVAHVDEAGIRQIVDLGSGLPVQNKEFRTGADTRVVYVDEDPVVCATARALLARPGRVGVLEADVRRPDVVLSAPLLTDLIDLREPVALLMMFSLHLVADDDGPDEIVAAYRDAVAPGSYLAIAHASADGRPETAARMVQLYEQTTSPFVPRTRDRVEGFFGDFALVAPGIVELWPFEELPEPIPETFRGTLWSGLARKPAPADER